MITMEIQGFGPPVDHKTFNLIDANETEFPVELWGRRDEMDRWLAQHEGRPGTATAIAGGDLQFQIVLDNGYATGSDNIYRLHFKRL